MQRWFGANVQKNRNSVAQSSEGLQVAEMRRCKGVAANMVNSIEYEIIKPFSWFYFGSYTNLKNYIVKFSFEQITLAVRSAAELLSM